MSSPIRDRKLRAVLSCYANVASDFSKGQTITNEPAQVRDDRRHGRLDLLERRHRLPQLAREIRQLVHLHILRPLLRHHQSIQTPAPLHHEDGPLLQGQEEERGAATLVPGRRQRLRCHVQGQEEPVHVDHVS